jgi:hypothetical protein
MKEGPQGLAAVFRFSEPAWFEQLGVVTVVRRHIRIIFWRTAGDELAGEK